ncbi:BatA domain-containing protein [Mangrovibacterium diazotrophicum]|uniref:Putative membrane protein YgcG n=1 Tax=Mangrovibacterium diazotrophicum TaxID=1261403 RepID=A0A419W592_9BACT|nr:BatA domain-containing protein [Mangrovibacterium diazotrophicum]RKD90590.1 putative membrane protein YgcG [Mangrovibacterium diazotrophicum]
MKGLKITILLLGLCGFFQGTSFAQGIRVKAVIDSTNVLIGDQFNLRLELEQPKDAQVAFPEVGDTLANGIEVMAQSPLDTFKLDESEQLKIIKNLTITSFDTGRNVVPSFKFKLVQDNMQQDLETLPAEFFVHGMEIDTTKGPTDIKHPYAAPVTLAEASPYILGAILILAIAFFIFYYIQRRRKNKPVFGKAAKPKEAPHVIALRELERIKDEKHWLEPAEVKMFYSDVSDTLRQYIQERYKINAMEYTTEETMQAFNKQKDLLADKSKVQLKDILSLSDLVKFAKYQPSPDDHNLTLMNAFFFVNDTKVEERKTEVKDEREGEEVDMK